MAAAIALSHHEHWDGQGYPHQLQGTSIPVEARICAVANAFDELLAVHPDAPEQAMLHIHSLSGSTFDPDCVEALHRKLPAALAVLTQFPR
jgi:putative two-component system response regulator